MHSLRLGFASLLLSLLTFNLAFTNNLKPASIPTTSTIVKMVENKGQWEENILFEAGIPGGKVFFEKQIHVVPNLNFDKMYYYSLDGVPIKKEIYRNSDLPESVVYYLVQKRYFIHCLTNMMNRFSTFKIAKTFSTRQKK